MENGRPNGYLEENAFFEAMKKVPMPGKDAILDAYRKAQALYASHGSPPSRRACSRRRCSPSTGCFWGRTF